MASELGERFVLPFARVVAEILEQLTDQKRDCEIVELPTATRDQKCEVALRTDPNVRFAVEFGEEEATYFAQALMGEPVADPVERQASVEEFWRQVVGKASTTLREVLRASDLDLITGEQPEWPVAMTTAVEIRGSGQATCSLVIRLSEAMAQFLEQPVVQADAVAPTSGSELPDIEVPGDRRNLDLLLDVPLSVTLRFGERKMLLREILKLNSGAVIELDRRADEPVDLFLDERMIARGQVVVVDGCYGLRVTEVYGQNSARPARGVGA